MLADPYLGARAIGDSVVLELPKRVVDELEPV